MFCEKRLCSASAHATFYYKPSRFTELDKATVDSSVNCRDKYESIDIEEKKTRQTLEKMRLETSASHKNEKEGLQKSISLPLTAFSQPRAFCNGYFCNNSFKIKEVFSSINLLKLRIWKSCSFGCKINLSNETHK